MSDGRPHPQISINGGPPCGPEQAAAIAAVARFLRDASSDGAMPAPPPESQWLRAAREEAVERL